MFKNERLSVLVQWCLNNTYRQAQPFLTLNSNSQQDSDIRPYTLGLPEAIDLRLKRLRSISAPCSLHARYAFSFRWKRAVIHNMLFDHGGLWWEYCHMRQGNTVLPVWSELRNNACLQGLLSITLLRSNLWFFLIFLWLCYKIWATILVFVN